MTTISLSLFSTLCASLQPHVLEHITTQMFLSVSLCHHDDWYLLVQFVADSAALATARMHYCPAVYAASRDRHNRKAFPTLRMCAIVQTAMHAFTCTWKFLPAGATTMQLQERLCTMKPEVEQESLLPLSHEEAPLT